MYSASNTDEQGYFLHRAYVLIGRRKWILYLVVPQLYVFIRLCRVVFWLTSSFYQIGAGIAMVPQFIIPYGNKIRIFVASIVSIWVSRANSSLLWSCVRT